MGVLHLFDKSETCRRDELRTCPTRLELSSYEFGPVHPFVINSDGYAKEYAPKAAAIIKAAGGRLLARGGAGGGTTLTTLEGEPFKGRLIIQQWDSMDKVTAWHNSADYKENRAIGDKFAKFRFVVVEGMPQ